MASTEDQKAEENSTVNLYIMVTKRFKLLNIQDNTYLEAV